MHLFVSSIRHVQIQIRSFKYKPMYLTLISVYSSKIGISSIKEDRESSYFSDTIRNPIKIVGFVL